MKLRFIFISLLAFSFVAEALAVNRFGIGFRAGFAPNQLSELNQGDRDAADTNERVENRLKLINQNYTNGTNYNQAPVIRDFRFSNDTNASTPIGLDFRYLWKDLVFQVGVTHYIIGDTRKSYFSVLGDLSTRSTDTSVGAYDDINENYDRDNEYVPNAVGLYPTEGLEYKYTEYTQGKRFDIPISIALRLTLGSQYSLFIGGGLSYHYGKSIRIIEAEATNDTNNIAPKLKADIDVFEAKTVGLFHFMTAEYQLTDRLAIYGTISFHYGESKLVKDKKITGEGTVNSLFHANDDNDEGGPEKTVSETVATGAGFQRFSHLSFSGIQAHFGVAFYLTEFR